MLKLITRAIKNGETLRVSEHIGLKFHARIGTGADSLNALGVTLEDALNNLERYLQRCLPRDHVAFSGVIVDDLHPQDNPL